MCAYSAAVADEVCVSQTDALFTGMYCSWWFFVLAWGLAAGYTKRRVRERGAMNPAELCMVVGALVALVALNVAGWGALAYVSCARGWQYARVGYKISYGMALLSQTGTLCTLAVAGWCQKMTAADYEMGIAIAAFTPVAMIILVCAITAFVVVLYAALSQYCAVVAGFTCIVAMMWAINDSAPVNASGNTSSTLSVTSPSANTMDNLSVTSGNALGSLSVIHGNAVTSGCGALSSTPDTASHSADGAVPHA